MDLHDLFRSTALRLALRFAILFSLVVLAVFMMVYLMATIELENRIKLAVELERRSLVATFDADGLPGLRTTVQRSADASLDGEFIYLLIGGEGKRAAGNVALVDGFQGWRHLHYSAFEFLKEQSDDPDYYYVQGSKIGGHTLLLGRSDHSVEETQEILLGGLLSSLPAIIILGLGGAFFIAQHTASRIRALERVLDAVAAGDLAQRVERDHSGDDLDRVSASINGALLRLERTVDSMRQISADIAHDLKTPIGRLRQKLETALNGKQDLKSYGQAIHAAISETDTIVDTFEALLRIAQIEAGSRRAKFQSLDLRPLLEHVVEAYEPVADEAGQKLTAALPDSACEIQGDHELLTQMFANLVANAIRHCPANTTIAVSLDRADGTVVARVADDGPGIPAEERDKVLRRLYRLEKSRTTPGSGLGLSLVAAIVDLHEARMSLQDNEPGLLVEIEFTREGADQRPVA